MVSLSDRLDFIVGAKAAGPLDEVFGIQTVDDLLRHYPRSYVEGASVRGAEDEQPPEGEHVTLVDVITDAALLSIKSRPRDKLFRVTLGSGRGKVTATFFHPKKWITDQLSKGTRVMLSGEVGYFRNAMQLTHPDFLVLDAADGRNHGSRSLKMIADASQAVSGKCCKRRSSAPSTRSIRPVRSCRAGTFSTAFGRCSRSWIRSRIRCLRSSVPHIIWRPKTRRCEPFTSPRTMPTGEEPVNG